MQGDLFPARRQRLLGEARKLGIPIVAVCDTELIYTCYRSPFADVFGRRRVVGTLELDVANDV